MKQTDKNTVTGIQEGTTHIKDNKGNIYEINESGVDDNGNKVMLAQDILKSVKWISPTKFRLPNGKVCSTDTNEQCFEAYNPNDKPIFFVNDHYDISTKHATPEIIKVEPDGFAFVPHSYYIPFYGSIENNTGETFQMVKNMGKTMFTGNKKASRLE